MDNPNIDRALVRRVQKGDKSAFDLLVIKYQFKVAKIVARYIHTPAEVEDVSQEVFIKAYRAVGGFRGDSAFYTWLYRIAVNTSKNHLVSQSRRPPASDIEVSDAEGMEIGRNFSEISTPEACLYGDELARRITDLLENLPDDLREAITLREFEGLSYDEIALVMQCPIGTVRSRIFRAREAIDKDLKTLLDL